MYYVYILNCADNKPYVGCTEDLDDRLNRHENGWIPATKGRLPVKLITFITFTNKYKAYEFEKYLKSGSGRTFMKRHLI